MSVQAVSSSLVNYSPNINIYFNVYTILQLLLPLLEVIWRAGAGRVLLAVVVAERWPLRGAKNDSKCMNRRPRPNVWDRMAGKRLSTFH